MFGEEILSAIKGVGDTVINAIDQFTMSPEEKAAAKLAARQAAFDAQTKIWEMTVKDRDSARQREMAVRDNTPSILAFMVVGGFISVSFAQFVCLYVWPEIKFPPEAWVLIGNVSGYMAAKSELALAYYFGASQGSDAKTKIMDRVMNHKDKDE
jgi:hypothetical protein